MKSQISIPVFSELAPTYPFIMPEAFRTLVSLLAIEDPEFPLEAIPRFGLNFFDKLIATYYSAMGIDVTFGYRRGNNPQELTLPLIPRKAVHVWLRRFITAYPDKLWNSLNIILRDIPVLIDPITEEPFKHKIIPRSCFPSEDASHAEASLLNKATGEYRMSVEKQ